jgi:hypothetical protein
MIRRFRHLLSALVVAFSLLLLGGSASGGIGCTTDTGGGDGGNGGNGNYGACCKICTIGQACGDTCISRDYNCHVGPGCACNG